MCLLARIKCTLRGAHSRKVRMAGCAGDLTNVNVIEQLDALSACAPKDDSDAAAGDSFEQSVAVKAAALAAASRQYLQSEAEARVARLVDAQEHSQSRFQEAIAQQQLLLAGQSTSALRSSLAELGGAFRDPSSAGAHVGTCTRDCGYFQAGTQ